MSITYHGNPTTAKQGYTVQNGSMTFAHTSIAGRDLILCSVLGLANHEAGSIAPTFDGVSLSPIGQKLINGFPGALHAYHRLADPGSKTANIVINTTTAGAIRGFVAWVLEISGLNSIPIGGSGQIADDIWGTDYSFAVSASLQASNSIALAMMSVRSSAGETITLDSPLTQIGTLEETSHTAAPIAGLGYVIGDGAGSQEYTGSWTGTPGYEQASVVELKAASATIPSKPKVIWI